MRYLLGTLATLALAAFSTGCAGIPNTPQYPAHITGEHPHPGADFCQSLEEPARSLQNSQVVGGWVFSGLAVGTIGGGAIVDLVNTLESRRITGTALMLGGVGLAGVAYHLFARADASGRLAEAANFGLTERDDRRAFEHCAMAKATWVANKSDAAAIAKEFVRRQEEERSHLEAEIEKLKGGAPAKGEPIKP